MRSLAISLCSRVGRGPLRSVHGLGDRVGIARVLVALVAPAVAVTIPSAGATARRPFASPRTLVEVADLAAFSQDGNRIAWVGWPKTKSCRWLVRVKDLKTKVERPLVQDRGPTCSLVRDLGGFEPRMALAGERAVWSYFTVSLSHFQIKVLMGAPGRHDLIVGSFEVYGGFEGHRPAPIVPMAGDGNTLVFAGFNDETGTKIEAGSAFRVTGRSSLVPASEGTTAVSAAGARFAVVRRMPAGCVCNRGSVWSPDATKLVFAGGANGALASDIQVINADGQSLRTLASAKEIRPIGWSSDGRRVFYLDSSGISAVDLNGQTRRLTRARWGSVGWTILSPDTRLLAYTSNDQVRVLDTATGAQRAVAAEQLYGLQWSPDGSRLAYTTNDETPTLRVVAVAGGSPLTLAESRDRYANFAWAPDGRAIAFDRGDALVVVSSDSGAARVVAPGATQLVGWSPDGSSLAFSRLDPNGTPPFTGLHVVAADGTGERRVAGPAVNAAWSPDSTELVYQISAGTIHVVRASGDHERRIAEGNFPTWSPTGGRIAYVIPKDDNTGWGEIAVVGRDGSGAATLTRTTPKPERFPVEIRRWKTGRLAARFTPAGSVQAVALEGPRIALLAEDRARKWIELRRTNGRSIRVTTVPKSVALELAMAGRWVVFRTGRTIRLLDLRSWRTSILTRASGEIVGLSIERRRVAWGELRRGADRIRAIVLPKYPTP